MNDFLKTENPLKNTAALRVRKLSEEFSVCKVSDYSMADLTASFCFIGKTDEENSLVCETSLVPANTTAREDGWKGFRIEGVLDFSLIGILAGLSAVLADAGIGIFAVSTFNTDYILVKAEHFARASDALTRAGYELI